MPGLLNRKQNIDQSRWTIAEWRGAFRWNVAFLVSWCTFFGIAILAMSSKAHFALYYVTVIVAVIGLILQIVNLREVRSTISRLHQETSVPKNN
jgi:hypothetical protein